MFSSYENACAALRAYEKELSVGIVAPHNDKMRDALKDAGKVLSMNGFRPVISLLAEKPGKNSVNHYMPATAEIEEDLDVFFALGEAAYAAALVC